MHLEKLAEVTRPPRVRTELEQLSQLAQCVLESHMAAKGTSWKECPWQPPGEYFPDVVSREGLPPRGHSYPPERFGVQQLLELLQKQIREVRTALSDLGTSSADGFVCSVNTAKLATEIGDAVNFLMMIADRTGALAGGGEPASRQKREEPEYQMAGVARTRAQLPAELRAALDALYGTSGSDSDFIVVARAAAVREAYGRLGTTQS